MLTVQLEQTPPDVYNIPLRDRQMIAERYALRLTGDPEKARRFANWEVRSNRVGTLWALYNYWAEFARC
jgi:hypothetical protein